MARIPHDDAVEDFDLHQLTGTNEVARHFDVGFGRRRVAARVITLQARVFFKEGSNFVQ